MCWWLDDTDSDRPVIKRHNLQTWGDWMRDEDLGEDPAIYQNWLKSIFRAETGFVYMHRMICFMHSLQNKTIKEATFELLWKEHEEEKILTVNINIQKNSKNMTLFSKREINLPLFPLQAPPRGRLVKKAAANLQVCFSFRPRPFSWACILQLNRHKVGHKRTEKRLNESRKRPE